MQESHITRAILLKTLSRYIKKNTPIQEPQLHLPTQITIKINQSQAFRTDFYEDITMLRSSIYDYVDVDQLDHLNRPTKQQSQPVPLCSLLHDINNYPDGDFFPQHIILRQKIKKYSQILDMSTWLSLYCNICRRFSSWQHPNHEKNIKYKRRIINNQHIDLKNSLSQIAVIAPSACQDQKECIQYHRQTLMSQIRQKEVAVKYFKTYKRAMWKKDKAVQTLTKFKAAISNMNVCLLKTIIWSGFTTSPYDPTCIELYFIIRSILNQGPLNLQALSVQMKKNIKNVEKCKMYIEPKFEMSRFAISRSQVCQGAGLFTLTKIYKNQQIGQYLGELVKIGKRKADKRLDYFSKIRLSSFSFQLNDGVDIDASFYGNYTRLINHMPDGYQNCAFIKSDLEVIVKATRDIEAGQEIFVDYGSTYRQPWKDIFDREIRRMGSAFRWKLAKKQRKPTVIQLQY